MNAVKHCRATLVGVLALGLALTGCGALGTAGSASAGFGTADQSQQPQAPAVAASPVELAHGHFRVQLPHGWQVRQIPDDFYQYNKQSATSVQFLNPEGQPMATLRTGADSEGPEALPTNPEDNTLVDGAAVSADEGTHLSFIAASAQPDAALLALSEVSPDQQSEYQLISPVFNYDGGSATFEREINPGDTLNGVDPDLHGAERMRAYTETEEYQQLKSLMMSFEQVKKAEVTPPPAPA